MPASLTGMGVSPTLASIRDKAASFPGEPYLLTVDAGHRPHCIPTTVAWVGDGIVVRAPSKWAGSEASGHRQVTLLWPSPSPGGYSLIVDGVAATADGTGQKLSIEPTRAVLHRSGPAVGGAESSCGSDCVPVFPT